MVDTVFPHHPSPYPPHRSPWWKKKVRTEEFSEIISLFLRQPPFFFYHANFNQRETCNVIMSLWEILALPRKKKTLPAIPQKNYKKEHRCLFRSDSMWNLIIIFWFSGVIFNRTGYLQPTNKVWRMTRTSLPWVINLLFHLYLCGKWLVILSWILLPSPPHVKMTFKLFCLLS